MNWQRNIPTTSRRSWSVFLVVLLLLHFLLILLLLLLLLLHFLPILILLLLLLFLLLLLLFFFLSSICLCLHHLIFHYHRFWGNAKMFVCQSVCEKSGEGKKRKNVWYKAGIYVGEKRKMNKHLFSLFGAFIGGNSEMVLDEFSSYRCVHTSSTDTSTSTDPSTLPTHRSHRYSSIDVDRRPVDYVWTHLGIKNNCLLRILTDVCKNCIPTYLLLISINFQ
jgi:hypothetical protein